MRNFDLPFGAVDVGLVEGDGKTDSGAEQLIVIGVIVDPAIENVGVKLQLTEKPLLRPTS